MAKIDRQKMRQDLFIAQLGSRLSYPFGALREFFEAVQDLFNEEQTKLLDWMGRETAGLSQDDKSRFYEWNGEDYGKLKDTFPNILRNSLFIAIYTELEEMLKLICDVLADEKKSPVSVHEWRGRILENVKSCLKKDIGVTWPISQKLWDEILRLRRIRNVLVHNGGWLDGAKGDDGKETQDAKLLKHIREGKKSIILLERDGFYKIQLTDLFIPEVVEAFEQLLAELFAVIPQCIRKE